MKNPILPIIAIAALGVFSIIGLVNSGYRNVETVKSSHREVWEAAGYEVQGYEGYQWGPIHGGGVWYIVTRKGRPEITYHGYLAKWGDEIHIYGLSAIDALSAR